MTNRRCALVFLSALAFAGVVYVAYHFQWLGVFSRNTEPYRDPLLDSFEVRTLTSEEAGGSSFSVAEPGTLSVSEDETTETTREEGDTPLIEQEIPSE